MTMLGRRMSGRSRYRTGNLMDSDGTLDEAVAPADPGAVIDGETGGGDPLLGIDIGVSIRL